MLHSQSSGTTTAQEDDGEGESEASSFQTFVSEAPELQSSSAATTYKDDVGRLEEFRQQWLVEIAKKRHHKKYEFRQHLNPPVNVSSNIPKSSPNLTPTTPSMDGRVYELATQLYRHGLRAERAGSLTQAVQCYRQATQLVPDIEYYYSTQNQQSTPGILSSSDGHSVSRTITPAIEEISTSDSSVSQFVSNISDVSHHGSITGRNLGIGSETPDSLNSGRNSPLELERLHISSLEHNENLPYYPPLQGIQSSGSGSGKSSVHISQLPTEILLIIFRWVVGKHLDIRQLDVLSEVCRGFYVLARDPSLWRSICRHRWGDDGTRDLFGGLYQSWRAMAIFRPHVHMDGCYIGRASYVRHGEPTIGQVYQACYIVEYYRIMRFMPDGRVFFLTSTSEPAVLVRHMTQLGMYSPAYLQNGGMHSAMAGQGLLSGHYRLVDGHLSCVLKRAKEEQVYTRRVTTAAARRGVSGNALEVSEQTFHLELQIRDSPHRLHGKLLWKHYSLLTVYRPSNQENVSEFDINNPQYQPLLFSRVKSFTSNISDEPLPYL